MDVDVVILPIKLDRLLGNASQIPSIAAETVVIDTSNNNSALDGRIGAHRMGRAELLRVSEQVGLSVV